MLWQTFHDTSIYTGLESRSFWESIHSRVPPRKKQFPRQKAIPTRMKQLEHTSSWGQKGGRPLVVPNPSNQMEGMLATARDFPLGKSAEQASSIEEWPQRARNNLLRQPHLHTQLARARDTGSKRAKMTCMIECGRGTSEAATLSSPSIVPRAPAPMPNYSQGTHREIGWMHIND